MSEVILFVYFGGLIFTIAFIPAWDLGDMKMREMAIRIVIWPLFLGISLFRGLRDALKREFNTSG